MNVNMSNTFVDKSLFYENLNKFYSDKKNQVKKPWDLKRTEKIIKLILDSRLAANKCQKRTNQQYYFSRFYDLIEIGESKKIAKKQKLETDPVIFVVPYEELYDRLVECHLSTGHGGRDKMKSFFRNKFSIPRAAVEIFIKCCKHCVEKKCQTRKKMVVNPIKEWNHRGQVDLIDFESIPDRDYKWLLNYEDLLTKFVHLRPLKTKNVEDVAETLLKIFLEFGPPTILQSDNGHEFVDSIIKLIQTFWPVCKLINGRRSVETRNKDVENMLKSWMEENNSQSWSLGCCFVQWTKNTSHNQEIGRSPYNALFGVQFPIGLPSDILESVSTEEDLEAVLGLSEVKSEVECMDIASPEVRNAEGEIVINQYY